MERSDIKNEILSFISDNIGNNKLTNINSFNGYYIIEIGKDFNTSFQIKGRKNWLFGIWIHEPSIEKQKFVVELFGQYIPFIDKFKPNRSPIVYSFEIPIDKEHIYNANQEYDYELCVFVDDILAIAKSENGALIKYYWNSYNGNPYLWLLKTYFHNILKFIVNYI